MYQIILIFHAMIAIALVVLVLLQHGKGADIGASFGSGASSTVFVSQGTGSFMLKVTGGIAAIFFATSLILGAIASHDVKQANNLADRVPVSQQQ